MLISIILITFTYLILILVPVFRGSVTEISKYLLSSTIFGLTAIWGLRSLYYRSYPNINLLKLSPLIFFILICILQTIPVPDTFLKILSGKSFELWDSSRNLLNILDYNNTRNFFNVSIYPYVTQSSLILLISYIIFGFFISGFFRSRTKILILIIPIILLTVIEGLIGIYQSIVIYGISHSQGAHGTFVNRNHYAGFMELGTPLTIGLILSFASNIYISNKNIIKSILNSDELFKQLILIFFLPLLLIAILISKSRMGIMSLFISLGFLYINLAQTGYKLKDAKWMITLVVLFFIFLSLYVGIGPVLNRFLNIGYDHRFYLWKDCLNIIRDFPLLGSGLGTFKYIYPLYKFNVTTAVDYNFAHNDYLQIIIETGILGFLAIIAAIIIFIRDTLQFLNINSENKDSFKYFITLGAFTGVISILIHSLADFNLHIPSNAIYFTTLIGIIYAVNSEEYLPSFRRNRHYPRNK